MKEDEKQFLIDVFKRCEPVPDIKFSFNIFAGKILPERVTPRDLINESNFYIHHKRAWYILDKWSNKDWYEYGVTLDLGWLTDKGKAKAKELIG